MFGDHHVEGSVLKDHSTRKAENTALKATNMTLLCIVKNGLIVGRELGYSI